MIFIRTHIPVADFAFNRRNKGFPSISVTNVVSTAPYPHRIFGFRETSEKQSPQQHVQTAEAPSRRHAFQKYNVFRWHCHKTLLCILRRQSNKTAMYRQPSDRFSQIAPPAFRSLYAPIFETEGTQKRRRLLQFRSNKQHAEGISLYLPPQMNSASI